MLTFIIALLFVIAAVVVCLIIDDRSYSGIDDFGFLLVLIIVAVIGFFIGAFVEEKVYDAAKKTQEQTVVEIVSMVDSTKLTGRGTYLRTYGSQESYIYRYTVKDDTYGHQVREIKNSEKVWVLQTNDRVPAVIEYKYKLDNPVLSFLVSESIFDKERKTVIVVPEGTINEEFEIDLK